jgi:hypothetical protein
LNDVEAPIPASGPAQLTPSHLAPGAQSESLEHSALQAVPCPLQANGAHDSAAV